MHTDIVRLDGHIIDSLVLSKVLDIILMNGGLYEITKFTVGSTRTDMTHAEIVIKANSVDLLEKIVHQVGQHGPRSSCACDWCPGGAIPALDAVFAL